jgi:hypothetical protein
MKTTKKHKKTTHKKYKNRKTKKIVKKYKNIFKGGTIYEHNIFANINTIGFEIETIDLIKLTKLEDNSDKLMNTSLANGDLEYGYFGEGEGKGVNELFTVETNDANTSFKITNDSADDTLFNIMLQDLYKKIDCSKDTLFLKVNERNQYLNSNYHFINFMEPTSEIINCSTFTDTEWILTYYKPIKSKNIIMDYFIDSYKKIKQHLNELIKINTSLNYIDKNNKQIPIKKAVNEVYVLPNTTLIYMNSLVNTSVVEYNILEDLQAVFQMTFSCNVLYIIKIMNQLLSFTENQLDILTEYGIKNKVNIQDKFDIQHDYNVEYNILHTIDEVTTSLFAAYSSNLNNNYLFTVQNDLLSKIKIYFKLIFYKIYCYLNYYLKNAETNKSYLFKKDLTFTVRHYNYEMYERIKELMAEYFKDKFNSNNMNSSNIDDEIVKIINIFIDGKINNENITDKLYKDDTLKRLKTLTNNDNIENNYGDPFYSINNYFHYFEKNEVIGSEIGSETGSETVSNDWLENSGIDGTSTKFPLENDNLIVEYRDFPNQLKLNLFINGNEYIRKKLLETNNIAITLKIIEEFIKTNNL